MTIDQMIEVLNAYKRGDKIEHRAIREGVWQPTLSPNWNFQLCEYRIAKPEPKKVKMLCCYDGYELRWWNGKEDDFPSTWIRIPEEDKEITLP